MELVYLLFAFSVFHT
jgi:hypothetical protein